MYENAAGPFTRHVCVCVCPCVSARVRECTWAPTSVFLWYNVAPKDDWNLMNKYRSMRNNFRLSMSVPLLWEKLWFMPLSVTAVLHWCQWNDYWKCHGGVYGCIEDWYNYEFPSASLYLKEFLWLFLTLALSRKCVSEFRIIRHRSRETRRAQNVRVFEIEHEDYK